MKTKVWSLTTRIFHWLLTIGIIAAVLLADDFFHWHIAFGYLVGTLLLFRLLWGFLGPRYSHFKDFNFSVRDFINTYVKKLEPAGHNPLASVVMILIMAAAMLTVVSGILTQASEGKGFFSFLAIAESEFYEESHEFFIVFLFILIGIHLLGIIVDRILHKQTNTLGSIFTGNKNIEGENVALSGGQKFFSFVWIIVALLVFSASVFSDTNIEKEHKQEKSNHEKHERHHKDDHD